MRPARKLKKVGVSEMLSLDIVNTMAFDGVGPSNTCAKISKEIGKLHVDYSIYCTRYRINDNIKIISPYNNVGKYLSYKYTRDFLEKKILQILIKNKKTDYVYIWPSCSLKAFRELRKNYKNVILETINFYTEEEKMIIDSEMDRDNFHYTHYVTKDKIEAQKEMLESSDLIFSSNSEALNSYLKYGYRKDKFKKTMF